VRLLLRLGVCVSENFMLWMCAQCRGAAKVCVLRELGRVLLCPAVEAGSHV
jgi:hypothetical protein